MSAQKVSFAITDLSNALEVPPPIGYYAWFNREPNQRQVETIDCWVNIIIISVQYSDLQNPAHSRTLQELGHNISEERVIHVMLENDLAVRPSHAWRCVTTKDDQNISVAADDPNRDFTATKVNNKLLTDVIFVPTDEG